MLMKKKKKKKSKKQNIDRTLSMSQMIINFAQDFISLGNTIEIKQSYLNAACVAWIISLLNENLRPQAVNTFLKQYQELNPGSNDVENVRQDIELLINEKLDMYPNERRSIVNALIEYDEKGNEKITIISNI
jgi:hypothetical protein